MVFSGMALVVVMALVYLALDVLYSSASLPIWVLAIPFLIFGSCLWPRKSRRLAAFGFGGLSILSNCFYVMASINPSYWLTPALIFLRRIAVLPAISALGTGWARIAIRADAKPRRSPFAAWALVVVLAIMPAISLLTLWPLRLAFLLCRPRLDSFEDRVDTGDWWIASSCWVGPFRLCQSGVDPDSKTVGLFADPNPSGRSGLVRVHSETLVTDGTAQDAFTLLRGTETNVELGWGWSYRQDD